LNSAFTSEDTEALEKYGMLHEFACIIIIMMSSDQRSSPCHPTNYENISAISLLSSSDQVAKQDKS